MDDIRTYVRSWSSGTLADDSPWNVTERFTTAGLDYIDRRHATGEPFFLPLNYQDPHPYFTAPEPYASTNKICLFGLLNKSHFERKLKLFSFFKKKAGQALVH